MSEFSSFKDMVDAGYAAIAGIQADDTLEPSEKEGLMRLDPTIEKVQRGIADIFAAEEETLRQAMEARKKDQG